MVKQLDKHNMRRMISIGETFNAKFILKEALNMKKANRVWLWCQVFNHLKLRLFVNQLEFNSKRILHNKRSTYRREQWSKRQGKQLLHQCQICLAQKIYLNYNGSVSLVQIICRRK